MAENDKQQSRRKFLYNLALAGISIPLISANSKCNNEASQKTSAQNKKEGKLGIAIVGLGTYGNILASALQETNHCYLAGIVTGTPSKISTWKERYNIPDNNIYNYESFDSIKNNPDIDIVYVVLPNSMHAEYTIRAAQAGKHVICEKPMALTVDDCDKMIAACKKAGKLLAIGYRLHFEPHNLEMQRLGGGKIYGNIKKLSAGFGFNINNPSQWRLTKSLAGGGPLQDLGIYCIQGLCYTSGMEPIAVTAKEGKKTDFEKFKEVEQSATWQMEMPNGLVCEGATSYADGMNYLEADAEKGKFGLRPAFGYSGQKGFTPEGEMNFPRVNQQAKQMDGIAIAIKNKKPTNVPGEMGRRDVKIIQAIYESMRTGNKISLK